MTHKDLDEKQELILRLYGYAQDSIVAGVPSLTLATELADTILDRQQTLLAEREAEALDEVKQLIKAPMTHKNLEAQLKEILECDAIDYDNPDYLLPRIKDLIIKREAEAVNDAFEYIDKRFYTSMYDREARIIYDEVTRVLNEYKAELERRKKEIES